MITNINKNNKYWKKFIMSCKDTIEIWKVVIIENYV